MERGSVHKALMKALRCHHKIFRNEFARFNISKGQPKILNYLSENNGCIQREIAKSCDIEAATATNVLSTMEKNGYIERIPNKYDRRIMNVYLTDKGKEAQENTENILCDLEEVCFNGFSKEEMDTAKDFFERIYDNLKKGERSLND